MVYRPGSTNPADFLSRHPVKPTSVRGRKVTEDYVNYICESACLKPMPLCKVINETQSDPMMRNVIDCVIHGNWHRYERCEEIASYRQLASELSVSENGLLLRGHRIVLPTCLCCAAVELAHEGHQGLVKTKSLLRSKVWFPNMNLLVERVLESCPACALVNKDERLHPLQMSVLPDRPWKMLSADFGGPYPSGHYCLVVIDEYSRFPVVEVLSSTSASCVIPVLDKIFATHGLPDTLKTDNGPPFQSHEFAKFMTYCGTKHRKIAPYWPRANAQAENFMKPLNKAIKSATAKGKSWRQELYKFLRNYRATPHVSTSRPPAELLFGRNIKVLLPEVPAPVLDEELRLRDYAQKAQQKCYADARHKKPTEQLRVGDTVVVRQPKVNKLSTAYNAVPLTVTNVKGTVVTAADTVAATGGSTTRNAALFKKVVDRRVQVLSETLPDPEVQVPAAPDPVVRVPAAPDLSVQTANQNLQRHTGSRPGRLRRMPGKYKDFVLK